LIRDNAGYLANPAHLVDVFRSPYASVAHLGSHAYYRPLVMVSFILDALIAPASPAMGHLTNLILHVVASCLVWVLLRRLGSHDDLALALALVFAVHPLAANAIGWVPGRNDLLLTVFALAAVLCAMGYLRTGTARTLLGACAALAG